MKAFPQEGQIEYRLIGNNWVIDKEQGMNLRDYFAAHIIQGLTANNLTCDDDDTVIKAAWGLADKMMEVRNATK